jgi:hypothetical protein
MPEQVHIRVYRDDGLYTAFGQREDEEGRVWLDADLIAHGETADKALANLAAQMRGGVPSR